MPNTLVPGSPAWIAAFNSGTGGLPAVAAAQAAPPAGGPASFSYTNPVAGVPPTNYDPSFGGIPQVPNPLATQSEVIGGNLMNLSQLYQLAGGVNTFNAGQAANQYELNLPGYDAMRTQQSDVIGQELAGQIPQDVINLIGTNAAERGVAGGQPGSPNANSAYLRALGLTSIGQEQTGIKNLDTAIRQTPTAPLFNPASMFVTPDSMQQAEMAASMYKSAPVPSAAAGAAERAAQAGVTAGGGGPTIGGSTPGGGGGGSRQPLTGPEMFTGVAGGPGTGVGFGGYQYPTTTVTRSGGASVGGIPPDKSLMFGAPWGDPLQPPPETRSAAAQDPNVEQAYQDFLYEQGFDDTEQAYQDFIDQFAGGSGPQDTMPDIYNYDFSGSTSEDDIWASLGV